MVSPVYIIHQREHGCFCCCCGFQNELDINPYFYQVFPLSLVSTNVQLLPSSAVELRHFFTTISINIMVNVQKLNGAQYSTSPRVAIVFNSVSTCL